MRLDELTQEILDDIFRIYKSITQSKEEIFPDAGEVKGHLSSAGIFEYRTGSSLCGNSKFIVASDEKVGFSFIPNCNSTRRSEKRKGDRMAKSFGRAVKNYLAENNLL